MAQQVELGVRNRNPDVLTSIANLSSDEVFTPPEFANRMLDTLAEAWAASNDGANIWADPNVTFLDPFTKSGVFLREITKRLVDGLESQIPDLQERVDHVLGTQVFGIAITELTALLARRSVYCSKWANGKHSIANCFDTEQGNIWFERGEHSWAGKKCRFCGASREQLDRGDVAETYAYPFIHTDDAAVLLAKHFGADVKFDVIIGNPPYQLGSDGGTRDVPIYQKFVNQALALEPRFLSMVIPARWMASGLGLGDFRSQMLSDRHIRNLFDFPNASEAFPGVEIKAGTCYFLWDALYDGETEVTTVRNGIEIGPVSRNLGEFDVLVRDAFSASVLRKVLALGEESITTIQAADKEFGWTSNFRGFHVEPASELVPLFYAPKTGKREIGYIERSNVLKSSHLIDTWKVMFSAAYNGGDAIPHQIIGKPFVVSAPSVCTQTYLFFHTDSESKAKSIASYMQTRFFRFLVSLRKITQHATKSTYSWVPIQAWDVIWTDALLYAKYGLDERDIEHIEGLIRPMEAEIAE